MERDFMGLAVKQETPDDDEPIDAAPLRSSAMHWPFSSKGSNVPQLLSFSGAQEASFDSHTSTGLVSLTTTETFNSDHKPYAVAQKNVGHEKQGGVQYAVTTYPSKHVDAQTIHRAVTQQPNLTISPTSGPNLIGSVVGVPLTNPNTAMASSPVVGTTDLRNAPKASGGHLSQLTIFYNGSVCVYDNISPEKAQAIMLLAGNGPAMPSSAAPTQISVPRSSVLDTFVVSQPYSTTPHHLSPIPVTAVSVSQYAAWPAANNDTVAAKPAGVIVSSAKIVEPLKVASSVGAVSATFLSSGTVPQSRRRSLARFLEKRKERVTSALPYAEKKSADCSMAGLSGNSSGSCPVPAVN